MAIIYRIIPIIGIFGHKYWHVEYKTWIPLWRYVEGSTSESIAGAEECINHLSSGAKIINQSEGGK